MQTFDDVFAIMQASFPPDEHRPREEQRALLQNPRYALHTIEEDGRVVAFAAVWQFSDFLFIEHLAVEESHRNRGLGAALLARLRAESNLRLCLEVELPENDLSRRRIAFYARNGFSFNAYPYMQPPISKGRAPVPLRLMSTGGPLTEAEFEAVRDTLFKEVYHTDKNDAFK